MTNFTPGWAEEVGLSDTMAVSSVNALHQILDTEDVILANGTFTVTLPLATGTNSVHAIKNIGTGTITLAAKAGETIDGDASIALAENEWAVVLDASAGIWYQI